MATEDSRPEYGSCDINIQWKNTSLCIDFHCSCTATDDRYAGHFDGYFGQRLECPRCGARYVLPQGFTLRAINERSHDDDEMWTQVDMSDQ